MFAKTIIDSDAFLEMPASSQLLYFHLGMRADDDGFINKPKSIMRMVNSSEDDMKLLIAKKFVIPFETGIVVIKHWKIHNFIAKDRYNETKYIDEKSTLSLDENNAYTQNLSTKCIQGVNEMDTQVRLGKVRLGKDNKDTVDKPQNKFTPPTLEEVKQYCLERNNNVNPKKWHSYYTSNGWKVGRNNMKDWKAAVRTWEDDNKKENSKATGNPFLNKLQKEGKI